MAQYSYKGAEPSELPARLTIPADQSPSGERETRTHLDKLSDDELLELGIVRIEPVVYDSKEYDCIWNSSEVRYELVELDEEEKAARAFVPESEPVADFEDFESRFTSLEIYRKLYESGTPFLIQLICEIRLMIIYRKWHGDFIERHDVPNLQQGVDILSIIEEAGVTKEDRDQFITNMRLANLDAELNIPTDEWIEHHWFENTGDIFTCIKADTHNIGD